MASKNELIEIKMRLVGARQVAEEGKYASKGVSGVGKAASYTGRESERSARKTGVLTRAYSHLGKAARYGIGFLGVGGIFALKSAVEHTEELSKTTTGLNRNLGLTAKESSRLAAVAYAREISTSSLTMATTKLGRAFVEANRKGGTSRTALNQLGITQEQTAEGAHNFGYALDLVAAKFGKAKAGPERQSAALSLLGKGYSTVLPMFSSGVKGLKEQEHWADKYGVTLDGKTNKSLMEMVNAQRESKIAMLGLQISLTKALMPAIEGGESQLQDFIKTLNDPKMSGAEKITAIEGQFEKLEGTLIKVLTAAIPKIAESGGKLGIALAGALWTGFKNSGLAGKLVITAWLLKYMGGTGVIKSVAGSAGKLMARGLLTVLFPMLAEELAVTGSLGLMLKNRWSTLGTTAGETFSRGMATGLIIGIPLALAAVWTQLSHKTKESIGHWGMEAGRSFVNFLISMINEGIEKINSVFDRSINVGPVHIHGPSIGTIGEIGAPGSGHVRGGPGPSPAPKAPGPTVNGPSGFHAGPKGQIVGPRHGNNAATHIHLHIDGKEVADVVTFHALQDAALS